MPPAVTTLSQDAKLVSSSLNAALCGLIGTVASHIAYVQSNMFILGDVTRRGRHPLYDPIAFDLMGLVGGVVIGIVVARVFSDSTTKAMLVGFAVTLLAVALAGGVSTLSRYRELYSHPDISVPNLVLDWELRLPADRDPISPLPDTVELSEGAKFGSKFPTSGKATRVEDGQIIMTGSVPLTKVAPDRILSFPHGDNWYAIFTLLLNDVPVEHEYNWSDWQTERLSRDDVPERSQNMIRYRLQVRPGG